MDQFHTLRLDNTDDAAAFIAAVSRFFASPAAGALHNGSFEIWANRNTTSPIVEVHLSETALHATILGFAYPETVGKKSRAEVETTSTRILSSAGVLGFGKEEIKPLLS